MKARDFYNCGGALLFGTIIAVILSPYHLPETVCFIVGGVAGIAGYFVTDKLQGRED